MYVRLSEGPLALRFRYSIKILFSLEILNKFCTKIESDILSLFHGRIFCICFH